MNDTSEYVRVKMHFSLLVIKGTVTAKEMAIELGCRFCVYDDDLCECLSQILCDVPKI